MKTSHEKKRTRLLEIMKERREKKKKDRSGLTWWRRLRLFMTIAHKTAYRDHRSSRRGHDRFITDMPAGPGMKFLGEVPSGTCIIVRKLHGGKDFTSRMASLGFTIGAEVKVVQNFRHGPMIVTVRGTRVALGRGQALKIQGEVV